jgi:hypothetical protein
MRIAVLIIGLLLGVVLFLQTLLVYGLSDAANDESTTAAGAIGVFMALLWLAACAFVIPFPLVSIIAFGLAGMAGLAVSGDFPDLAIWGVISFVLGGLSLIGWRGKVKADRAAAAERERQRQRDEQMAQLLQWRS